jgi:hypothetical protein
MDHGSMEKHRTGKNMLTLGKKVRIFRTYGKIFEPNHETLPCLQDSKIERGAGAITRHQSLRKSYVDITSGV